MVIQESVREDGGSLVCPCCWRLI